jgi:hypothetical protein
LIIKVFTKAETLPRYSAAVLRAFIADALRAAGLTPAYADIAADAMLEADVTGSDAHGVFRLAGYVRQIKKGRINPSAKVRVVERSSASALIDGDHAMGHVVMTQAAALAVELAGASGVGWVGARNSNHAGAGAVYRDDARSPHGRHLWRSFERQPYGPVGRHRGAPRHQPDRGCHPGGGGATGGARHRHFGCVERSYPHP